MEESVGLALGGVEGKSSGLSFSKLARSSFRTTVEVEDSHPEREAEEEFEDKGNAKEELESLKIASSEGEGEPEGPLLVFIPLDNND